MIREEPTIPVKIHWLDRKTGQTGLFEDVLFPEDPETWGDPPGTPGLFNWIENNFSCDCNRGRFFIDEDVSCSNEDYAEMGGDRFVVTKYEWQGGHCECEVKGTCTQLGHRSNW